MKYHKKGSSGLRIFCFFCLSVISVVYNQLANIQPFFVYKTVENIKTVFNSEILLLLKVPKEFLLALLAE